MCGIAGLMKRSNRGLVESAKDEVDNMLSEIRHRGPDDTGVCGISLNHKLMPESKAVFLKEKVQGIFGFDRLSIQDISAAGHQPMLSLDAKVVLTFNGEIYNVNELREILIQNGIKDFRGHSDTEVILNLYLLYGFDKMIRMLNGMFAIVLYDTQKEKIYIARDRFGIIPIYIWESNDKLVWASEIKCFRFLNDFNREINRETFAKLFLYCNPNDPMYDKVENIVPGHYIEFDVMENCKRRDCKYFDLNEYKQTRYVRKNYLEEAEEIIKQCVKRQLISDVNLGVQFSGGIDSTLLAKYVSKEYEKKGEEVYGFSLVNRGSRAHDEEQWIDHASSCLGLQVKKIDMNFDHFIVNFEKSLYAYERFLNEPGPIGVYEFSKNAGNDVKVLISGEGADEVCGGYNNFPGFKVYEDIHKMTGNLFSDKFADTNVSADSDAFLMAFDMQLKEDECRKIYPDFDKNGILEERRELIRSFTGTAFDRARKLYFSGELVTLCEKQNKTCMANSIENRVPFLDNEFVEYMFQIPERELMHNTYLRMIMSGNMDFSKAYEGKYILKCLSAQTFGNEFAFRKKMALRIPMSEYIRNKKMHEYIMEQILPGMKNRGLINAEYFLKCYDNLDENENAMVVWKAMNAELWCQLFVDCRSVH